MKYIKVCTRVSAIGKYHWRLASTTTNSTAQARTAVTHEESPRSDEIEKQKPKKDIKHVQDQASFEPKRPAFAKDIFLGKFDTNLLTYPEVLEKDRHETLHDMLGPIERFFEEKVDSKQIDKDAKIPDEVMNGLKELGLFGQQIPQEYGGLGLNATEYARLQEVIFLDGSIGVTLAAHQSIGLKGLLMYGTEEQKSKYLPKLATGETIAAFCLTEPSSGSDAASIQTKATLSDDGKTWFLDGSKLWISNGGIADFFTVFAKTDNFEGKSTRKLTAFIVERKFGGITSGKPEDKLGIRGSNTTEVNFENTPVPLENVLGEVGDGFKIAVNILNTGRFGMGSAGAGVLKKLIEMTTDHAVNRKQFGKSIGEFNLIKEKIGRMTITTYAMESMAYLTAGLIDSNEYEDCAIEAAMVKVFSSEGMWKTASECLQIVGGMGYMKEFPYERILRDARVSMIFEGTNEILRMFIALMGVQHAGKHLAVEVKKLRNPFANPTAIFSKAFQRARHNSDNPKLILGLHEFLHPTLKEDADLLEYSVLRLQYAVEVALERFGKEITNAQLELKLLADIAIDIYAMTAVLSRASRAYCLGLHNADTEMQIAMCFCRQAHVRVQTRVKDLDDGKFVTSDSLVIEIANTVLEKKKYCLEHPLKRAFW